MQRLKIIFVITGTYKKDYKKYFDRVYVSLGGNTADNVSTDAWMRIKALLISASKN